MEPASYKYFQKGQYVWREAFDEDGAPLYVTTLPGEEETTEITQLQYQTVNATRRDMIAEAVAQAEADKQAMIAEVNTKLSSLGITVDELVVVTGVTQVPLLPSPGVVQN